MHQPMNVMGRHQTGVALIVVLLFLILITMAGAIAVRQSTVDLKVATSDQAGALMLNSSDSVLSHIEQAAGSPSAAGYATITSLDRGILGYFMLNGQEKIGDQLSFCYQPLAQDLYTRANSYIRSWGNNTTNQSTGFCNPSVSGHYTSGRNTTMTQVVVTSLDNSNLNNFKAFATRTSVGEIGNSYTPQVQVNSLSLLPAMSNVSDADIMTCLRRPVGDISKYGLSTVKAPNKFEEGRNMNECLRELGVPANALVEESVIEARQDYGYDAETGDLDDACAGNANCN